jgi:hypothetical protein
VRPISVLPADILISRVDFPKTFTFKTNLGISQRKLPGCSRTFGNFGINNSSMLLQDHCDASCISTTPTYFSLPVCLVKLLKGTDNFTWTQNIKRLEVLHITSLLTSLRQLTINNLMSSIIQVFRVIYLFLVPNYPMELVASPYDQISINLEWKFQDSGLRTLLSCA